MPTPRSRLGQRAEIEAASELVRRGYHIIDSNFRTRYGEIDLIARDGGVLVFVEVRSHKSTAFGTPAESITYAKQKKLRTTAKIYLCSKNLTEASCRFDVVEVVFIDDDPEIRIIKDAF